MDTTPVDSRRNVNDRVIYMQGILRLMPDSPAKIAAKELLNLLDLSRIDLGISFLRAPADDPLDLLYHLEKDVRRLRLKLQAWADAT